ncbi:uncharacterized protein LOC112493515 [Ziziphus jujuba]|uniref:Uncharacterized protein LOC112493515 n=1 Tax=Ziziphus jujuba TaxID=326968 RepID=A0ABM4A1H1_ZIZJJ|nr:uncharacterized protein LOC125420669 [Ziziphus jujuba var. spinosa]XP_060670563.1 uncharacterized protein LOC112493515 [Ziziphus jujuba]
MSRVSMNIHRNLHFQMDIYGILMEISVVGRNLSCRSKDYGGPDTISSFALEDNESWLRNLFGFILQVVDACYCFLLTLLDNKLWFPTILVFIVGNVKYAERTIALYLANFNRFGSPVHDFEEPNAEGDYWWFLLR